MTGFNWLVCPHCGERLVVEGLVAGCASGHRFDVARQGYLNLLGHAPGANADTAAMVEARQRFLAAGHYSPIRDAVAAVAVAARARAVVEVGAGTGYYLAGVLDALAGAGVGHAEGLGVDISPAAARRLAKAHPAARAVVADVWQGLPLVDACADLVACIFAPRNAAEFARVLRPGGRLVTVTPGPGHLAQARQAFGLMAVQDDKDARLVDSLAPQFTRRDRTEVAFGLDLDAATAAALVDMGPNALHEHGTVTALRVDVEVVVSTWQPAG
ncbi:putative RNA methyltransferase [Propionibacteriaceae bacterium G1746]|uniref:putative RNA methyltransferase n=1 Tax=Aestuariimicrobium sp. G57 TaxID=3418485 RepID=UPI003C234F8E